MRIMRLGIWIVTVMSCLLLGACSQSGEPEEKTAAQLAADGWKAYSAHDYQTAASTFAEAIGKDANLVDGYDGAGWANAKLDSLTAAVSNFRTGMNKDSLNLEIKAGLSLVYNAQKNYSGSISLARDVIRSNSAWSFSHDASVGASSLRLLLAEDYFALAEYDLSLQQIQVLNPSFTADVSTVSGQGAVGQEIERLRGILG